jgi:hypothetical protein
MADSFFAGLFGNSTGSNDTAPPAPVTNSAPNAAQQGQQGQQGTPPTNATDAKPSGEMTLDDFAGFMRQSGQGKDSANADEPAPLDLVAFAQDEEAIGKLASKLSFVDTLPQDLKDGINTGDVAAILKGMEHIGKQAYTRALQHSVLAAGQGVKSNQQALPARINSQVEAILKEQAVNSAIPEGAHPATAMVLQSLAKGLADKGLSPKDAMKSAASILRDMGASLETKPNQAGTKQKSFDDWIKD